MSDTSDRNFVIIMFIILYAYMLNIQKRISVKDDWSNKKCNPLNLFTSSLYDTQEESNKKFGTCIKEFSRGVASDEVSTLVNKQKDEFVKIANLANTNMVDISRNITYQSDKIGEKYVNTNKKIDNTNNSLKELTDYVKPGQPDKPSLYDKLENFKNEMKTIFSNIQNYVIK